VLDIAVQIADGLASAHAGSHRAGVKILDFGLAKQRQVPPEADETIAADHTAPGMIVGTVRSTSAAERSIIGPTSAHWA